MILYVMSSCVPMCSSRHTVWFRNCTKDTLFIGLSYYDNIDSVNGNLCPNVKVFGSDSLEMTIIHQIKWLNIHSTDFVAPDSMCSTVLEYLFNQHDSCYFFLIKEEDAMKYSWEEIRAKRLYRKWVIARDSDGNFDRNVRYQ